MLANYSVHRPLVDELTHFLGHGSQYLNAMTQGPTKPSAERHFKAPFGSGQHRRGDNALNGAAKQSLTFGRGHAEMTGDL